MRTLFLKCTYTVVCYSVISLCEVSLIVTRLFEGGKLFAFNNVHDSLNVILTTQKKKFSSILEFSVFLSPIQSRGKKQIRKRRSLYQRSRNFKHYDEILLMLPINKENLKKKKASRLCPLTCFLFLLGDSFCPHQLLDSYRQINGSQDDEPVVL